MEEYLAWSKNIQAELSSTSEVQIVLGNESCDLDSAVSAVVYAYYLRNKYKDSAVIPVLNIPESKFRLRTETTHFFNYLNISSNNLTFRDQIDFTSLKSDGKLKLHLVDHNALAGSDGIFNDCVVTVIDHHVQEQPAKDGVRVKLDFVGSCCTLVAEELLDDPEFGIDKTVAELLFGTILVDTINKSPSAGKITPRDQDVLDKLQTIIPEIKGDNLFQNLQAAKFDMSGLENMEILEKDLKMVPGSGMTIAMASVTMDMEELLKRPDFQTDLAEFSMKKGADVVVIMTLTTDDNDTPSRQIAVYSLNRIYKDQIADVLDNTADESLELEPCFPPFDSVTVFKQGNIKASRKKVMPILKSFLQGDVTPDVTSKEFVPQQSVSMTTEGFTSFTNLLESGENGNGADSNPNEESQNEPSKTVLFNLDSIDALENHSPERADKVIDQEKEQVNIKSNLATVNTQITNPGVTFDIFATQNDDEGLGSLIQQSEAGNVSKPDNPFSQFSSTNLSSVNSSNMLDFLPSDSELVDPFSSVEENLTPALTNQSNKTESVSSDIGLTQNQNQPLLDFSDGNNATEGTNSSGPKLIDTNPFFDVTTDNAQPSSASVDVNTLVDLTNTSGEVASSNTNNSNIFDDMMSDSDPFGVNSVPQNTQDVMNNPFLLPENVGQLNSENYSNRDDKDKSSVPGLLDMNFDSTPLTVSDIGNVEKPDITGVTDKDSNKNGFNADSMDPFGIFDTPSSQDNTNQSNNNSSFLGNEITNSDNPFDITSNTQRELSKDNPFNLPSDTTLATESHFEDMPDSENPFQMDYLDIDNEGSKTSRPKARKSISLIVEIDQHSEEKLDELNEADFFDKVPTPDIQHSGENSPFINSGVSSPLEGIPTPNVNRVSGFPSLSTPPNSVMEETGFDTRDHDLPSFNNAEMVERIHRKKASLGNIGNLSDLTDSDLADTDKTEVEIEGNVSVPYTPQNSFHDDAPIPSVNLILPDIDSPEMESTIQEKRNSLITAQDFTSAEEDFLGLNSSKDESVTNTNPNNIFDDPKPNTSDFDTQNESVFGTSEEHVDNLGFGQNESKSNTDQELVGNLDSGWNESMFVTDKDSVDGVGEDSIINVPYTPANSFVDSSGASFMQNRDNFTGTELFDRLNDIRRDRSNTGHNSVTEIVDADNRLDKEDYGSKLLDVDEKMFPEKVSDTNVAICDINPLTENNSHLDIDSLDGRPQEAKNKQQQQMESENNRKHLPDNITVIEDLLGLETTTTTTTTFPDTKDEQQIGTKDISNVIKVDSKSKLNEMDTLEQESMIQKVETEVVQDFSESLTSELINHAVDVFPDMTNPDVAECVTMEILTYSSSDWMDQGSGDSGIGSSDSPQQAVARAPPRSPRSPRRVPASQYSLETDYMPNMDPFQGNLNIVTSPSASVQSVETDAGKEVVEEESFRRVSVEVGHEIPSETVATDELQDVPEVTETSISDMIISENLEQSKDCDIPEQSKDCDIPTDEITSEQSTDLPGIPIHGATESENFLGLNIEEQTRQHSNGNEILKQSEDSRTETKTDSINVVDTNNEEIFTGDIENITLMKESESIEEIMDNTAPFGANFVNTENESPNNSEEINDRALSNEGLTADDSNLMQQDRNPADVAITDSSGPSDVELTNTPLQQEQVIPPSDLLLEGVNSSTNKPVEINIEGCSISPDSSNSFNSSSDSEVDLITVRENIIDSSPTEIVGQIEETITEIGPNRKPSDSVNDLTDENNVMKDIEKENIQSDVRNKEIGTMDSLTKETENNLLASSLYDNKLDDKLAESTLTIETISPAETPDHEHASGFYEVNPEVKGDELEGSIVETNLGENETGFYEFNPDMNDMTESAVASESASLAETSDNIKFTGFSEVNSQNMIDNTAGMSVSQTDITPEISISMTESTETENSDTDGGNTGFYEMNSEIQGTVLQNIEIGDAFSPAESPNDDIVGLSYQINPMIPDLRNQSSVDTDENEKSDLSVFESVSTTDTKPSIDEDSNATDDTLFIMADGLVNEAIKGAFETVHDINTNDDTDVVREIADAMIENDENSEDKENIVPFQQKPHNCSLEQAAVTRFLKKSDDFEDDDEDDKSSESSEDSDISSTTTEGSYRINSSPIMTPESESVLEEHMKKMRSKEVYVIEESANEDLEEEEAVDEMVINNETHKTLHSEMKHDVNDETNKALYSEIKQDIQESTETDKQFSLEESQKEIPDRSRDVDNEHSESFATNEVVKLDDDVKDTTNVTDKSDGSVTTLPRQDTIIPDIVIIPDIDIVISTEDSIDREEQEDDVDINKHSDDSQSKPKHDQEIETDATNDALDESECTENKLIDDKSGTNNESIESDLDDKDKKKETGEVNKQYSGEMIDGVSDNKVRESHETGAISKIRTKKEESSVTITKSKLAEQEYTTRKEVFYTTAGRMSLSIDSVVDPPGVADHVFHERSQNPISEEVMRGLFEPPLDQPLKYSMR